mmetsp:Transcript_124559/g.387855  ORF Transcript_124559/g.387855 Transcript_124559/m.387855 type:complete len:243 (+) Transcript_124559:436-1164(+)
MGTSQGAAAILRAGGWRSGAPSARAGTGAESGEAPRGHAAEAQLGGQQHRRPAVEPQGVRRAHQVDGRRRHEVAAHEREALDGLQAKAVGPSALAQGPLRRVPGRPRRGGATAAPAKGAPGLTSAAAKGAGGAGRCAADARRQLRWAANDHGCLLPGGLARHGLCSRRQSGGRGFTGPRPPGGRLCGGVPAAAHAPPAPAGRGHAVRGAARAAASRASHPGGGHGRHATGPRARVAPRTPGG